MADSIIAVGIRKLYYGGTDLFGEDNYPSAVTGPALAKTLADMEEIPNIHQDTWSLEEAEGTTKGYKNQLTGLNYRFEKSEMGEISLNFTIGEYDYPLKAAMLGGTATDTGWSRAAGKVLVEKCFVAVTEDDQYICIPRAVVIGREATADNAVQLPVKATELEPKNPNIAPEYWFDASVVTQGRAEA